MGRGHGTAAVRFVRAEVDGAVVAATVDGDALVPFATEGADVAVGGAQDALVAAATARSAPPPTADPVRLADATLLAPVGRPPSVRDFYAFEAHVATARRGRGLDMDPDWYELPVFYFSNPASIVGPGATVAAPPGCTQLDYELEVAVVVGREVADLDADGWLDAVAGFCVMNDWSARDLQAREMRQGLGPAKGKDFATSLGPWLVTPDELPDVASGRPRAAMVARVDGRERSRGRLEDIHHPWGDLLAHAARGTRLLPGDVVGSGTVGTGCILELSLSHGPEAEPWLTPGAVVELEVEGLGTLRNTVAG
ncbi:fumarylacetoacetate hydrolase family protein [Iamia sp. SCSIO 61187]|uniref:fumarylacetoacetate hydrolase family protein n=1 Tax=Iamia sp. SCSIO 61187 TaxID=2722752 RepID=UPI001C625FA2|nr:fumarylacetoacetate hydrolase family protein [Iamia sp. SCSIO 61187]QYG93797.1 fumarylacetoacetate hydrolase family protein [Iamia sp. SCSIO 61187]